MILSAFLIVVAAGYLAFDQVSDLAMMTIESSSTIKNWTSVGTN